MQWKQKIHALVAVRLFPANSAVILKFIILAFLKVRVVLNLWIFWIFSWINSRPGLVGMDIKSDNFVKTIANISLYDTGYAFLLNRQYNFLVQVNQLAEEGMARMSETQREKGDIFNSSEEFLGTINFLLFLMSLYSQKGESLNIAKMEGKNMATAVEVRDLKKYFGRVKAVDGISFQVKRGTIFGMLGPNGAGKTTTIETMVGLNKRDGGEIEILGLDPAENLRELKLKIGVQLQSPSLFPRLTVYELVRLFSSFYPDPLPEEEVIARVGLESKKNVQVEALSGGQRHRLAVALAMVGNGEIIFLDEPTTGLDPQARRQLWEVILQLKEEGVTVFLTTHYMDEAENLCDGLVIIDRGKIIAQGSPRELINTHFKERALEFVDPGFTDDERKQIEESGLATRVTYEKEDKHIILYTEDIAPTLTGLMDYAEQVDKPIKDFTVRQATLEDVFLKLTGRGIRE